jgi:hypothetical protein
LQHSQQQWRTWYVPRLCDLARKGFQHMAGARTINSNQHTCTAQIAKHRAVLVSAIRPYAGVLQV